MTVPQFPVMVLIRSISDKTRRHFKLYWRRTTFKLLEEFFEFINGKSGVSDYTTHCVGINGVITRNRKESCAVRHYHIKQLSQLLGHLYL